MLFSLTGKGTYKQAHSLLMTWVMLSFLFRLLRLLLFYLWNTFTCVHHPFLLVKQARQAFKKYMWEKKRSMIFYYLPIPIFLQAGKTRKRSAAKKKGDNVLNPRSTWTTTITTLTSTLLSTHVSTSGFSKLIQVFTSYNLVLKLYLSTKFQFSSFIHKYYTCFFLF